MTNERERAASERIAADPFGVHEALHTAHVLMDSYALHVVEHPAVELRPDILALGEKAVEAMMDVYQALGALDCDETAYLLRSPRNAKRLRDGIRELDEGRGVEREGMGG